MQPTFAGIGTQMRTVLDHMESGVAAALDSLGVAGYRPRFSPIVRALTALGPLPIRDLARATSVTHSAASQTVAQMAKAGLVRLRPGTDGRERIVELTDHARALRPRLDAEWNATSAAIAELDQELPYPLAELIPTLLEALRQQPFADRVAAHLAMPAAEGAVASTGARPDADAPSKPM